MPIRRSTPTVRLVVELEPVLDSVLRQIATDRNTTMSDIQIRALEQYLAPWLRVARAAQAKQMEGASNG